MNRVPEIVEQSQLIRPVSKNDVIIQPLPQVQVAPIQVQGMVQALDSSFQVAGGSWKFRMRTAAGDEIEIQKDSDSVAPQKRGWF